MCNVALVHKCINGFLRMRSTPSVSMLDRLTLKLPELHIDYLMFVNIGVDSTESFVFKIRIEIHYTDVIMSAMASQITSLMIGCSTVYSGVDPRKHQSSASLSFVRVIHRWPVNSPHKVPVTQKMFSFDDVIMC